ncbi:hypothetical protein HID58_061964 [Brassica napus]|uniref:Uncharacterized protein n=1 Tax=Brassica napus TaxID=3708 RepID=A0ABQ8A0A2_BRANA|nr:hypothetical protein HID58_061964 [Brassica napus]
MKDSILYRSSSSESSAGLSVSDLFNLPQELFFEPSSFSDRLLS